jgi:hypothetical protein
MGTDKDENSSSVEYVVLMQGCLPLPDWQEDHQGRIWRMYPAHVDDKEEW